MSEEVWKLRPGQEMKQSSVETGKSLLRKDRRAQDYKRLCHCAINLGDGEMEERASNIWG